MIQVNTGDARPLFRQIVDGIRLKVASGEFPAGMKLPSVRGLALMLTVNTNTVAKAYAALADEGLVEARRGVGLFVCEPRQTLSDDERERRLRQALKEFVGAVVSLGFPAETLLERVASELEPLVDREVEP